MPVPRVARRPAQDLLGGLPRDRRADREPECNGGDPYRRGAPDTVFQVLHDALDTDEGIPPGICGAGTQGVLGFSLMVCSIFIAGALGRWAEGTTTW